MCSTMELILKSNNKQNIAEILALAKKLNMRVERRHTDVGKSDREEMKNRILNFKAKGDNKFGDAAEWERKERDNRNLPFS